MSELYIEGGKPLRGSVHIQGSKNAALPCMAAAVLARDVSVLKGCPRISDVFCMEAILCSLGARTWWDGTDLYLDCTDVTENEIPKAYAGAMRSSVLLFSPLLARTKQAAAGPPGGCVIGKRPIDLHLEILRKMGVCIREENGMLYASAPFLQGTDLVLRMRSVGATEQGILAGVCARGRTTLFPCAREPEIVCLCRFLRKMGAQIEGEGSDQIRITGVERLHGAYMTLPADRIVAGTYLCAGAATRGYVELDGAPKEELTALLEVYQKMGGQYEYRSGKLIADSTGVRNPVPCLSTDVYPGFPTDLQSPVLAVFATIPGVSRIRESVFEDRFKAAESLRQFGARIRTSGCEAEITGGYPLTGCRTQAQELRGGAALVVAALSAKGHSIVSGYSFIRRGYEDICRDLTALGGCVRESTG